VTNNLLDLTVGLEVVKGLAGERTVDLKTIDEGGDGDQAVRLDILVELVGDVLVEDNSVLGLVLDCAAVSSNSPAKRCLCARPLCGCADVGWWIPARPADALESWKCAGGAVAVSRTLALGPLLLLLLASGC
jgi:hypothetical protein